MVATLLMVSVLVALIAVLVRLERRHSEEPEASKWTRSRRLDVGSGYRRCGCGTMYASATGAEQCARCGGRPMRARTQERADEVKARHENVLMMASAPRRRRLP